MSVKSRIKKFIQETGLSVSAFEKSINVTNGYINSISKSIGNEKLNVILEKYPKLNVEWLLTGSGSMLKEENGTMVNGHLSGNSINGNVGNIHINSSDLSTMSEKGKVLYHEYQLLLKENEGLKREIELLKEMVAMLKGKSKR